MSIKCNYNCGDTDYERFYGKWRLKNISNTEITSYNGVGIIELKEDKSSIANFSYFFTFDTLNASDSLFGNWSIDVDNYQGVCSEELILNANHQSKSYSFKFENSEMIWEGSDNVIYWDKIK